jgi:hypothetical protein
VDENRARSVRETLTSESGQWLINRDLSTRKALVRLREIAAGPAPEAGAEAPAVTGESTAGVEEPAASAGKKKRTKKASQSQ